LPFALKKDVKEKEAQPTDVELTEEELNAAAGGISNEPVYRQGVTKRK